MFLKGFSIKLTIVVFSGFVFHVAYHDIHRQCFDVESQTICYFMPNVSSIDWNTAWKTCKELDATLPVILNEEGQSVLGDYLSKYFPLQPVWTAGRYVGSNSEWRWLNGQDFRGTEKPSCLYSRGPCIHESQAVLTKELKYVARFPNYPLEFICSFTALHCTSESEKSIAWKGGCLNWEKGYRLPLNRARNNCLKGGGDLATFSEDGDLHRLREVSYFFTNASNHYWVGLHRKWWIWNSTDINDIKYNLLDDYGDLGKDCLFIDERSKWSRDRCSFNKSVICQTETRQRISADEPVTAITGIVIGVIVGSVLLIVFISVIILHGRKIRNTRTKADVQADIDKTYEDLHHTGMADVPIASVDNGFYTDLVPTQLARNVHHHDEPLYEDL